jgi:predicted Rossmann fold nucleotide-binding protein DprA/Smf involved in DNA uptake
MMHLRKVNAENGLFEEDVLLEFIPLLDGGEPNPAYIETPCPGGYYWPRWNYETQQWEEGGTAPESHPHEPTEIEILQTENQKLKERLVATEQIAAETSITQQQLLELLIEMEVI